MTIHINIPAHIFQTPWPYLALYVLGFLITANICMIQYRKQIQSEWIPDGDIYFFITIFWPIVVAAITGLHIFKFLFYVVTLPGRLYKVK